MVNYSSLSRNSLGDGLDLNHKKNKALFTKTCSGLDLARLCSLPTSELYREWQTGLQFYWRTSMPVCLPSICVCFHTLTEWV